VPVPKISGRRTHNASLMPGCLVFARKFALFALEVAPVRGPPILYSAILPKARLLVAVSGGHLHYQYAFAN